MKRFWLWAPLAIFVIFFITVASGLYAPDDRNHPSKMIGKALPTFELPAAARDRPALSSRDFTGQPRLLNVFASWCVPCIAEAPVLTQLAAQGVIIEGIAIRDRPTDVDRFLATNGNPYRAIGSDVDSTIQLSIGSSGVPETFVIDGAGKIRHQHIGDITPTDVPVILAALSDAK
ncbi:DsbE family thiol:disulfide interchange protein [Sphingomonas sp.]|uniref:DsbE family thiol:disulfide interchange protein n=1 Tax=Sphingomonas sp. TaxID=28214 RepID=UPI0025CE4733|nr:DsbE family thiol:disulfide interchange protein [Sphingomonas sp.]